MGLQRVGHDGAETLSEFFSLSIMPSRSIHAVMIGLSFFLIFKISNGIFDNILLHVYVYVYTHPTFFFNLFIPLWTQVVSMAWLL